MSGFKVPIVDMTLSAPHASLPMLNRVLLHALSPAVLGNKSFWRITLYKTEIEVLPSKYAAFHYVGLTYNNDLFRQMLHDAVRHLCENQGLTNPFERKGVKEAIALIERLIPKALGLNDNKTTAKLIGDHMGEGWLGNIPKTVTPGRERNLFLCEAAEYDKFDTRTPEPGVVLFTPPHKVEFDPSLLDGIQRIENNDTLDKVRSYLLQIQSPNLLADVLRLLDKSIW